MAKNPPNVFNHLNAYLMLGLAANQNLAMRISAPDLRCWWTRKWKPGLFTRGANRLLNDDDVTELNRVKDFDISMVIVWKTIREATQEMPHSWRTSFQGPKRRYNEEIMIKWTPNMKPPMHKQRRTETEEPPWNRQRAGVCICVCVRVCARACVCGAWVVGVGRGGGRVGEEVKRLKTFTRYFSINNMVEIYSLLQYQ